MEEPHLDIDIPEEGPEETPRLPSAVIAKQHLTPDGESVDLDATMRALIEGMQSKPVPVTPGEMMLVMQEGHERTTLWMCDILFKALAELGALPDGYVNAMTQAGKALEYFRLSSLYDFMQAKEAQRVALAAKAEETRLKSLGLDPGQTTIDEVIGEPVEG